MDTQKKKPTSFKLSKEALRLLKQLSARMGLSQAALIELAVRKLAQGEASPSLGLAAVPEAKLAELPQPNGHDRDFTANGRKIRAYRLRKMRWRQEDLAKAAGVQIGTISRIETGFHTPQLATIVKIAQALGVEVDDIVDWHEDPDD